MNHLLLSFMTIIFILAGILAAVFVWLPIGWAALVTGWLFFVMYGQLSGEEF